MLPIMKEINLQNICYYAVANNSFMKKFAILLQDLPIHVLWKVAVVSSPFGIHLLENLCNINASTLGELWFSKWYLPPGCKLAVRAYLRHTINWFPYKAERDTEQQTYYNMLLKLVVEGMISFSSKADATIDLDIATLVARICFLDLSKTNLEDAKPICNKFLNNTTFLKYLSKHATCLNLTEQIASQIIAHEDVHPILRNVSTIYINLLKGPFRNFDELVKVIHALRDIGCLKYVHLTYNTHLRKNLDAKWKTKLFSALCEPINVDNKEFSIYDEFDDCESEPSLDDDLYDIAVQTRENKVKVQTNITHLTINSNCENVEEEMSKYLCEWTNLKYLCVPLQILSTEFYESIAYRTLQALELQTCIDEETLPRLENILSPTCCCGANRRKSNIMRFRCASSLPFKFLRTILTAPQCYLSNSESLTTESKCKISGLQSLELNIEKNISEVLANNKTLKELHLHQTKQMTCDNDLCASLAEHPCLETFKMNSYYRKPSKTLPTSLTLLLSVPTLTQLSLERCFHSETFGEEVISALKKSKLVVFEYIDSNLGNKGLIELAEIFLSSGMKDLEILNLSGNTFEEDSISHFADAMISQQRVLRKLILHLHYKTNRSVVDKIKCCTQSVMEYSPGREVGCADYVSEM